MNLNVYLLVLGIIIVMPLTAYSQRRMMSTKSSSELIRMTNPKVINSVGKIEGTEIERSRNSSNQQQNVQQYYIDDDYYNSQYEFSDDVASRALENDENNRDIGFTKF